jgi:hypothetical protein
MISGEGKSCLGRWVAPTADPENIDHQKKDELKEPEEKKSFFTCWTTYFPWTKEL